MENLLREFIQDALPVERGDLLLEVDNTLQSIGRQDHHTAIENILSLADDVDTATTVQRVEDTLYYELADVISDYGIGIKEPNFRLMISILRGMHDVVSFDDHQSILDICDEDGTPEETIAQILALLYSADETEYLNCIEYVAPSLVSRISSNMAQKVEQYEWDDDDVMDETPEPQQEPMAVKLRRFVERYRPEGFQSLLRNGYRLGYAIDSYLQHTLDPEIRDSDYLAREYLAAALASGEELDTAINRASERLESRIDDVAVLQRAIQGMAGYQI